MALYFLVAACLVAGVHCDAEAVATAEPKADAKAVTPSPYHVTTPYAAYSPAYHSPTPVYPVTPIAYHPGHAVIPVVHHAPAYPAPHHAYAPAPVYAHKPHCGYEKVPSCSYNTTKPWCLGDYEYPEYEVKAAIAHHKHKVLELYADVADLATENSVIRARTLHEETYLCPSETGYVRPLRAVNTEGKWRVIVNNIKVDYELFTQTTRLEECLTGGDACPLVPHCYESKCLQKSIYHRFLVYDPCDEYFPFAIESFKLPASCACLLGAYRLPHH